MVNVKHVVILILAQIPWECGGIGRRAGLKNQIDFNSLKYINL